jgi:excisionase family DNA binding protein
LTVNELTEEDLKDMISIDEAAAMLPGARRGKHLHYSCVYRWVKKGKLPGWKLGGKLCVLKRDVLSLFKPVPTKLSHPPRLAGSVELRRQAARTEALLDAALYPRGHG